MFDAVKRIGELMKEFGYSAYELSNLTGMSANAVYDWFKTGATPTLGNIVKLCDSMGVSLEYFFCGDEGLDDRTAGALKKWLALSDAERRSVMNLRRAFNGK